MSEEDNTGAMKSNTDRVRVVRQFDERNLQRGGGVIRQAIVERRSQDSGRRRDNDNYEVLDRPVSDYASREFKHMQATWASFTSFSSGTLSST